MTERNTPLYQGRDWFSYRWTVAQTFDAIDRLMDLCQSHHAPEIAAALGDDGQIIALCDELGEMLGAYLSTSFADTLPALSRRGNFAHEWLCFEARQIHKTMMKQLQTEDETPSGSDEGTTPLSCLFALKDLIKKIDT